MKRFIIVAALASLSAGIASAQSAGPAQLAATETASFGKIVTDAEGRALYMFSADKQGASSACYDACATAWPPLLSEGQPKLGQEIKADMVGNITRKDGAKQVTYNGWPLYYFARDTEAGKATGQDKHGFGGDWYVVSSAGQAVKADEQKAEADKKAR